MATLPSGVLWLFWVVFSILFAWMFWRDGNYTLLKSAGLKDGLKKCLVLVVPFLLLTFVGQAINAGCSIDLDSTWFVVFLCLPLLLRSALVPPRLNGLLIAGLAVAAISVQPAACTAMRLLSMLFGLFVWKASDFLMPNNDSEKTLEDFLPAAAILGGSYWLMVSASSAANNQTALFVSAVSAMFLVRWFQGPFMRDDHWHLKKTILSATGGLAVLITITKLISDLTLQKEALLVTVVLWLVYFIEQDGRAKTDRLVPDMLVQLISIGAITFAGMRMFGVNCLPVLAACAIPATVSGATRAAGCFWLSLLLLNAYCVQFNHNVSGINVQHAFTTAALFGGFILSAYQACAPADRMPKSIRAFSFYALVLFGSGLLNYLFRAEPLGAAIIATSAGAMLFFIVSPLLATRSDRSTEELLLVPLGLAICAPLTHSFIDLGLTATAQDRMVFLGVLAVALAVAGYLIWMIERVKKGPTQIEASN